MHHLLKTCFLSRQKFRFIKNWTFVPDGLHKDFSASEMENKLYTDSRSWHILLNIPIYEKLIFNPLIRDSLWNWDLPVWGVPQKEWISTGSIWAIFGPEAHSSGHKVFKLFINSAQPAQESAVVRLREVPAHIRWFETKEVVVYLITMSDMPRLKFNNLKMTIMFDD